MGEGWDEGVCAARRRFARGRPNFSPGIIEGRERGFAERESQNLTEPHNKKRRVADNLAARRPCRLLLMKARLGL